MIAIVTESLSCMTRKDQESLNVVPVLLECVIDGESYPDYFVTEESAVKPGSHSLPPSASAYRSVFAKLLEEGYEVLCITIRSAVLMTMQSKRKTIWILIKFVLSTAIP